MTDPSSFLPIRFRDLVSKELKETYRDLRTIMTLVVMPLLLYPILSLLAYNFLPKPKLENDPVGFRIGFGSVEDHDLLFPKIRAGHENLKYDATSIADKPPVPTLDQDSQPQALDQPQKKADLQIEQLPLEDHEWVAVDEKLSDRDWLEEGRADAILRLDPKDKTILIAYNPEDSFSIRAFQYLSKRIQSASLLRAKVIAKRAGFNLPVNRTKEIAVSIEKKATVNFAAIVPLILIMMTITGAVYPAIDLTAGERERGTLETLVASPIPKTGMLAAKFLAVWSVAMLTALVNIASLSITLWVLQLDTSLLGPSGLSIILVLKIFLLLSLFALFFSAVLLLLTSFAQSFKEAQSYLVPLMVFSLAPAMAGLSPSVQLTAMISLIPMVNLVLLTRDLLQGTALALPATLSVLSTVLYSASVLSIASKTFGSDAVLYGTGSWKDLFAKKADRSIPSATFSFTALAIMFPVQFLLLGVMGRYSAGLSATGQVLSIAGGTILIFFIAPTVLLTAGRFHKRNSFGLRWPGFLSMFAAVLLGLSLWPVSLAATWAVGYLAESILTTEGQGWISQVSSLASQQVENWKQVPVWLLVLCLAVTPAVCEELFFRGLLFRSLSAGGKKWMPIVVSAVAFGLFHFITESSIAPLRLLVTTGLGIVLGWVAYQTNSVLPSMLLHAINNSILLNISLLKNQMKEGGFSDGGSSTVVIFAAVVLVLLGLSFWILSLQRKNLNHRAGSIAASFLVLCVLSAWSGTSLAGFSKYNPLQKNSLANRQRSDSFKPAQTKEKENLPTIAKGWTISRFAGPKRVHDIHTLAIGPNDELFVAGPKQLVQLIDQDNDGHAEEKRSFGFLPKSSPQGLWVDRRWIYVVSDGGIWKIDREQIEKPVRVLKLPKTGGEHHFHAIKPADEPNSFYFIAGNYSGVDRLPVSKSSPIQKPRYGVIGKWNFRTSELEILVDGIRNAYDFAQTKEGHWVLYDSDDERESGLPWYRPITLFLAPTGSDIGWRSRCLKIGGPFGFAKPIAETGRGSPTGVAIQKTAGWGKEWNQAIVFADWTFGRIYLKGASETDPVIVLASSNNSTGFAVTGMSFDSKGNLWVAVGGRGTKGSVYRISRNLKEPCDEKVAFPAVTRDYDIEPLGQALKQKPKGSEPNKSSLESEGSLLISALQSRGRFGHSFSEEQIREIGFKLYEHYSKSIEKQLKAKQHQKLVPTCNRLLTALTFLHPPIIQNDSKTDPWDFLKVQGNLSLSEKQGKLLHQVLDEVVANSHRISGPTQRLKLLRSVAKLQLLTKSSKHSFLKTMLALGDEVTESESPVLCIDWLTLLTGIGDPFSKNDLVPSKIEGQALRFLSQFDRLMSKNAIRTDRKWSSRIRPIFKRLLVVLPNLKTSIATKIAWTRMNQVQVLRHLPFSLQRRIVPKWLGSQNRWNLAKPNPMVRSFLGEWTGRIRKNSRNIPPALQTANSVLKKLSQADQDSAMKTLQMGVKSLDLSSSKNLVNTNWKKEVEKIIKKTNWNRGRVKEGEVIYRARLCYDCHEDQSVHSPDLAGLTGRFSLGDIVPAIVNPHKDVSDRYRQTILQLEDGQVIVGKEVYSSSDAVVFKDTSGKVWNLDRDEISQQKRSKISAMPTGLMDKATNQQWADLLAYLKSK